MPDRRRKREADDDGDQPTHFRCTNVEELTVNAVSIDEQPDYSPMAEADLGYLNKTSFPYEQVLKGKITGFKVLDHHQVYEVITSEAAKGIPVVDTTWAITQSAELEERGEVKCRLVGRDYK